MFQKITVLLLLLFFFGINVYSQNDTLNLKIRGSKIIKLDLKEQIDPKARRATNKAFELAAQHHADAIIIEMNTPGGLLNEADSIRTKIIDSDIPVYVLINPNAASAGALISIACNKIYMASGSTIGAATVVTQNAEALPDKYQSYMRGMMRSTAELRGRNPKIAEAMVDQNLDLDSLAPTGQVLTLTRSEAIVVGYCDGKAETIEEVLAAENYEDYEIVEVTFSGMDKFINFLINPFIHGLLILIIIGGIYYELQSPGIGFPLAAAVTAAIFYFAPLYIEQLAASWEILIFVVGIILIGLEIFVIPGFGVAGISGIVLVFTGLILAMVRNIGFDFTFTGGDEIVKAFVVVTVASLAGVLFIFITGKQFIQSRFFQRIALQDTLSQSKIRYQSISTNNNQPVPNFENRIGTTYTKMTPSGKVIIDNEIFNAITEGEFIDKDSQVIVLKDFGNKLLVRSKDDIA